MPPQTGVNGVLPVQVLQKNGPASHPRGQKAPQPRMKLLCRRLPPGMSQGEFEAILGHEWKAGAGKVDYLRYTNGKLSRDPAKPSKPANAYIQVTQQSYINLLGDRIREATFHDAAKSFQDPALVGPPTLIFAPYSKMPGGRRRNDNRQGTIDQDQEFKDFLESLTNPIAKPAAPEVEGQKEEKVKTTPLIEALREKKANKDKPQGKAAAKHARGEPKEDGADAKKILAKPGKDATLAAGDKNRKLNKAEKALQAAAAKASKEASSSKDTQSEKPAPATQTPATERKRGNVNIAKSLISRDLGVGPSASRRRGTKREITPAAQETEAHSEDTPPAAGKQKAKESVPTSTTNPEKGNPATPKKERPTRAERRAFKAGLTDKTNVKATGEDNTPPAKGTSPAPTILKKSQQSTQAPTGPKGQTSSRAPPTEPAATRNAPTPSQATPAKPAVTPPPRPANPTPNTAAAAPAVAPVSTGKQAFLKHANASQGITEPLIEEALQTYGSVEKVEIDKRKGFAYVDFTEPEGLQKAIAASPVKVAQGAVQVLERKEKVARNPRFNGPPTGPARGRGGFPLRGRGRGGGRGGHAVPTSSAANDATATSAASVSAPNPTAVGDAAT